MMKDHGGAEPDAGVCERLRRLWSELLERPEIGLVDDFFKAGGSSMQVIEMLWAVSESFDKEIDHMEFYKDPCIRRLGELLEG